MQLSDNTITQYVKDAITSITTYPSTVAKISNMGDVERWVAVLGIDKKDQYQTFAAPLKVFYFENGELTNKYRQPRVQELYTDNSILQIVRDANLQPVPNPDYQATIDDPNNPGQTIQNPDQSDESKYETIPGFEMINEILVQNIPITTQLDNFIAINDQLGLFDQF